MNASHVPTLSVAARNARAAYERAVERYDDLTQVGATDDTLRLALDDVDNTEEFLAAVLEEETAELSAGCNRNYTVIPLDA